MTLAELSRRVGLDKSWTSRTVDVLVEAGLLIKEAGTPDHRTIRITFSPAGMARYTDLKDTLNAQAERVLGRIPAHEQANVYHALKLLQEALWAETAGASAQPNERGHQA
jgi:DNA-binding MarR family transcriptional regulator